jgi:hypothetical protein
MFRYRAWNINGPGEFSDTAYLVAARVPGRPPKPQYLSSTDSSILVSILPTADDGGKIVTQIKLEISAYSGNTWTPISSYDGISLTHSLTASNDGLLTGNKYKLRVIA